ncbi:lipoprotein-attachment site-containing protein [Paraburkholderia lycopersici]|uniref:Lipoprotein-attachment site-containing protein n=1 Tax=Paraburkholderia lycopersici TaxID=416944 RepID=A0A1G6YA20_9BURK|nr:lipoprotein [Paraburkholderia lycopersici]SDD87152.1 lipoprotein-attachment site-containing protein [Paraburkholderia lycopersici]
MRVISQMRAAASRVSTPGAILAAFAVCAVALAGCGQRGPLYMPTVPPLPPKPSFETAPPQTGASAPEAASAPVGSIPDTSGTPLSLSPDSEVSTPSATTGSPQPASGATPTQ